MTEETGWPTTPMVELERPFADARGEIQPLVETTMQSALMISSRKGSVRANHYHRSDWHYCYVVSGTMEYFHRPVGNQESPERLLVRTGQMVFTPPMVEHAMRFPEDTVFLTLSRNARDQTAYENDLVRTTLIEAEALV